MFLQKTGGGIINIQGMKYYRKLKALVKWRVFMDVLMLILLFAVTNHYN